MEKTIKLMHDISTAENHTAQIEADVKAIDQDLKTIHNDLEISQKVNTSLHNLNNCINTANELLTVVSIIPEIGEEASLLKNTLTTFQQPIKVAVSESDAVEKIVKPIRDDIATLDNKVERADQILLQAMNTENKFIDILGSAQHCINSLPGSDLKTKLDSGIDTFSGTIDPAVLKFDSIQVKVLKTVDDAKNMADEIKSWAVGLISLENEIQSVINTLNPLISALKNLANVFSQTIRVPYGGYPKICYKWGIPYTCGWHTCYFSFTIKQILDGVSGVLKPVMDLLNKAMYAILNPLLNALHLNIKLPEIPGLNILKTIEANLQGYFNSVVAGFNSVFNEIAKIQQFEADIEKVYNEFAEINKECQLNIGGKKAEHVQAVEEMPA